MYEGMLRCFSFQFELRHKLCCTNFPDKGIVDVNFLLAVAAALVTLIKRKSDKDRILIYLGFVLAPQIGQCTQWELCCSCSFMDNTAYS